jgi:hypothetical protein
MTKRTNLAAALHEAGAKPAHMTLPAPAIASAEHAETSTPSSVRPPSRVGLRAVTAYVSPEVHRQLRLLGLDQGLSVQELMVEAINELFRKHDKRRTVESDRSKLDATT